MGAFVIPQFTELEIPQHRLRARWGRGGARLAVNITALIDVTFLLLIYFMVATDFRLTEEVYRLDLPAREGTTSAGDPFELDQSPLRIHIATSTVDPSAYSIRVDGPYEQPTSFADLNDFLRRRIRTAGSSEGMFEPDQPIVIQPSRTTRWEHAVEALNAAAKARYTNVTFVRPR